MVDNINKHGPRSDLMQGVGLNRGSPPSCPVKHPYIQVIEPPGYHRRRHSEPVHRWNVFFAEPFIVCGLPVSSHTGLPEYSPPYLTHQPDSQLVTATVKHVLFGVRGEVCVQRSAFSSQQSAISRQQSVFHLSLMNRD